VKYTTENGCQYIHTIVDERQYKFIVTHTHNNNSSNRRILLKYQSVSCKRIILRCLVRVCECGFSRCYFFLYQKWWIRLTILSCSYISNNSS